jgi:hypothetical protein
VKVSQFRLAEVESFPRPLEAGVVYYSERFSGAAHACACGCGMEVITPISPVQWRITRNARGVSLRPSIGNWNFPCRSHYWIIDSTVHWSADMTENQIRAGRAYNSALREQYFKAKNAEQSPSTPQPSPSADRGNLLARLINFLSGRLRW